MRLVFALTFIEILISIGIFSIVALGLLGILITFDRMWNLDINLVELQQTCRNSIERVLKDIRSFENPQLENNGTKIVNASGDSYYLDNNEIIYQANGTQQVLATDISSLCFCWDNTTNLCGVNCQKVYNIRVNVAKNVRGRDIQFNLTEKVWLRN